MLLQQIKDAVNTFIPNVGNKIKRINHYDANNKMIDELYYSDWGIPKPFLGTSAPTGWVICNGIIPTKLRTDCHPDFVKIMVAAGYIGNGSTTINIPIIAPGSSLVQAGTDVVSGEVFSLGQYVNGEVKHKLIESELASHTHTQALHNHTINRDDGSGGDGVHFQDETGNPTSSEIYTTSSIAPTIYSTGGNQFHNNMPPSFVVNYILRYA